MLAVPSDTEDFAYTVSFFKVEAGGTLKLRLNDGTVRVLKVRAGEYVNLPVRRIYRTGTTASGFQNDLLTGGDEAVNNLPIPYSTEVPVLLLCDDGVPLLTDDGLNLFV